MNIKKLLDHGNVVLTITKNRGILTQERHIIQESYKNYFKTTEYTENVVFIYKENGKKYKTEHLKRDIITHSVKLLCNINENNIEEIEHYLEDATRYIDRINNILKPANIQILEYFKYNFQINHYESPQFIKKFKTKYIVGYKDVVYNFEVMGKKHEKEIESFKKMIKNNSKIYVKNALKSTKEHIRDTLKGMLE